MMYYEFHILAALVRIASTHTQTHRQTHTHTDTRVRTIVQSHLDHLMPCAVHASYTEIIHMISVLEW